MTATATQFGIWTNRGGQANNIGQTPGIHGQITDNSIGSSDSRFILPRWMRTVERTRSWQDLLGSHFDWVTQFQRSPTVALNTADAQTFSNGTPLLEFTGTDADGETITYQIEIATGVATNISFLSDAFDFETPLDNIDNKEAGSTFVSLGGRLTNVVLSARKGGAPTGNVFAKIYAVTDVNSAPTGAALATSDAVDVTTLAAGTTNGYTPQTFTFSGANKILFTAGNAYAAVVSYVGGNGFDRVYVGFRSTERADTNSAFLWFNWSVWEVDNWNTSFTINVEPVVGKLSASDSGFVNEITGGDTDPFNSGEKIGFTVQSGDTLAVGTYSWRVRGKDPLGSNAWGDWTATRTLIIQAGRTLAITSGSFTLTGEAVNLLWKRVVAPAQGSYALNGQTVALARGKIITPAQGSFALNGQTVSFLFKRVLPVTQGAYVLNGQIILLERGRFIAMVQGAFGLTGQALALKWAHLIPLVKGAFALTGQATGLYRGYPLVSVAGSYALSGRSVALSRGVAMSIVQGSYALSGMAQSLLRGYMIAVSQGAFSITGQNVALERSRIMSLTQGSFALSGQIVILEKGRFIALTQGAFSLSGQNIGLLRVHQIIPTQGTFALTGQSIALSVQHRITLGQGAFVWNGQAVSLVYSPINSRSILIDTGSYVLSGKDVILKADRRLTMTQGSFALNGQTVNFLHLRSITMAQGAFVLNGQPIAFLRMRIMPANMGSFALTGEDVGLLRNKRVSIGTGIFDVTGKNVNFPRTYVLATPAGFFVVTGFPLHVIRPGLFEYIIDLLNGYEQTESGLIVEQMTTSGLSTDGTTSGLEIGLTGD